MRLSLGYLIVGALFVGCASSPQVVAPASAPGVHRVMEQRPCVKPVWTARIPAGTRLLAQKRTFRGRNYHLNFSLDQVAPHPILRGIGGITTNSALTQKLSGCSDSPSADGFAQAGQTYVDTAQALTVRIESVTPAGKSGRDWPGVRCSYRVHDQQQDAISAIFSGADVPPFNELTAVWREEDAVFASLNFNGYANEIDNNGNRLAGLDLCSHRVMWQSANATNNGQFIVYKHYIITGYGFSAEPDFLYVLNRYTGEVIETVKLPKAPKDLRIALVNLQPHLFVRIFDGYVRFKLLD